jgi:osmotically-inducible protein OsmY
MASLTLSDRELLQIVLRELQWHRDLEAADIRVEVDAGVVTLQGTVDSYWQRWAAEQAVRGVPGVRAVVNAVEVNERDQIDDTELAKAVTAALERNPLVPHDQITVSIREGWVTLEGEVEWGVAREEAEETARKVSRVVGVTNLIAVKPVRDNIVEVEVKRSIVRTFVRNAEDDAERVYVRAEGGHVTLTGAVRSTFEHVEAERAAWRAPGVSSVTNRIVVRPD